MTPCPFCGKPFEYVTTKPGPARMTCSKKCARARDNQLRDMRRAGIEVVRPPPIPRLRACETCGRHFIGRAAGMKQRMCSEACRKEARRAAWRARYVAKDATGSIRAANLVHARNARECMRAWKAEVLAELGRMRVQRAEEMARLRELLGRCA